MMKLYCDKGLLGWLDNGMTYLHPQIILNKQVGPEHGTYKYLPPAPKNLGLRQDISQGPGMVIVIISFTIINHILYRPVPIPFVIAIENLRFNKTLHSVTCINCKLYTCVTTLLF